MTRDRRSFGVIGVSAERDLNVFRLFGVFHAVDEGIVRFEFF